MADNDDTTTPQNDNESTAKKGTMKKLGGSALKLGKYGIVTAGKGTAKLIGAHLDEAGLGFVTAVGRKSAGDYKDYKTKKEAEKARAKREMDRALAAEAREKLLAMNRERKEEENRIKSENSQNERNQARTKSVHNTLETKMKDAIRSDFEKRRKQSDEANKQIKSFQDNINTKTENLSQKVLQNQVYMGEASAMRKRVRDSLTNPSLANQNDIKNSFMDVAQDGAEPANTRYLDMADITGHKAPTKKANNNRADGRKPKSYVPPPKAELVSFPGPKTPVNKDIIAFPKSNPNVNNVTKLHEKPEEERPKPRIIKPETKLDMPKNVSQDNGEGFDAELLNGAKAAYTSVRDYMSGGKTGIEDMVEKMGLMLASLNSIENNIGNVSEKVTEISDGSDELVENSKETLKEITKGFGDQTSLQKAIEKSQGGRSIRNASGFAIDAEGGAGGGGKGIIDSLLENPLGTLKDAALGYMGFKGAKSLLSTGLSLGKNKATNKLLKSIAPMKKLAKRFAYVGAGLTAMDAVHDYMNMSDANEELKKDPENEDKKIEADKKSYGFAGGVLGSVAGAVAGGIAGFFTAGPGGVAPGIATGASTGYEAGNFAGEYIAPDAKDDRRAHQWYLPGGLPGQGGPTTIAPHERRAHKEYMQQRLEERKNNQVIINNNQVVPQQESSPPSSDRISITDQHSGGSATPAFNAMETKIFAIGTPLVP